jgi:hypothetical protein
MQGPYYPLPIVVAFLAGYFAYRWIRGSYSYWVWILPAVSLLTAMVYWKGATQASWFEALAHFFKRLPYPESLVQLPTAGLLLMSLTYSLAALVRAVGGRAASSARTEA